MLKQTFGSVCIALVCSMWIFCTNLKLTLGDDGRCAVSPLSIYTNSRRETASLAWRLGVNRWTSCCWRRNLNLSSLPVSHWLIIYLGEAERGREGEVERESDKQIIALCGCGEKKTFQQDHPFFQHMCTDHHCAAWIKPQGYELSFRSASTPRRSRQL